MGVSIRSSEHCEFSAVRCQFGLSSRWEGSAAVAERPSADKAGGRGTYGAGSAAAVRAVALAGAGVAVAVRKSQLTFSCHACWTSGCSPLLARSLDTWARGSALQDW